MGRIESTGSWIPPTAGWAWTPPGDTIPGTEFKLLDLLGRGGMGEVWAVEDVKGEFRHDGARGLVVKFLSPEFFASHPEMAKAFADEAKHGQEFRNEFLAPTIKFINLDGYSGWPPCALLMDRHEPSLSAVLKDLKKLRHAVASNDRDPHRSPHRSGNRGAASNVSPRAS